MPTPFGNFHGFDAASQSGKNTSDESLFPVDQEFDAHEYFISQFPEMRDQFQDHTADYAGIDEMSDNEEGVVMAAAMSAVTAVIGGLQGSDTDRAKAEYILASLAAQLPVHLQVAYVTTVIATTIAMNIGNQNKN